MKRIRGVALLALVLAPICYRQLPAQTMPPRVPESTLASGDAAVWLQQLDAWRAKRERELSAPSGWLTLVGLEWLKPGVNTFGTAADNRIRINAQAPDHIGMLTVSGSVVQLLSPSGGFPPDLQIDGKPAREGTLSADDQKPSTLTWHSLTMVVLPRGGRYALRTKDDKSPTRAAFHGLHWYAPDAHYRVTARWFPFTPPHIEKIPTIIGTTLDLPAPGIAEFTLDGKTLRLEPVIEGGEKDKLFFILRDETSHNISARFIEPSRLRYTRPKRAIALSMQLSFCVAGPWTQCFSAIR